MSFKQTAAINELFEMLSTCRPHRSKAERRFIRTWIEPLGVETDGFGNLIKRIGELPVVLWSSHTDTVHFQGGTQEIVLDQDGYIGLSATSKASCLGADCTTGVWIMRQMIKAGVEGLYIFHRGEECGGIGSNAIARKTPELLDGIKFAIAFDRRGTRDVITHQGTRCASDAFADSLAKQLNVDSLLSYTRDDSGIFTDTANYTHLIPECSNISVGYSGAHGKNEKQDMLHLQLLLSQLLKLDTSKLVESRKVDDFDDYNDQELLGNVGRIMRGWDSDSDFTGNLKPIRPAKKELLFDLADLLREYPADSAEYIESYGITAEDIASFIYDRKGYVRFP